MLHSPQSVNIRRTDVSWSPASRWRTWRSGGLAGVGARFPSAQRHRADSDSTDEASSLSCDHGVPGCGCPPVHRMEGSMMDAARFDGLVRRFGQSRSRRQTLRQGVQEERPVLLRQLRRVHRRLDRRQRGHLLPGGSDELRWALRELPGRRGLGRRHLLPRVLGRPSNLHRPQHRPPLSMPAPGRRRRQRLCRQRAVRHRLLGLPPPARRASPSSAPLPVRVAWCVPDGAGDLGRSPLSG
jgi:hypothetical protein